MLLLVTEIGDTIRHLRLIGLLKGGELDEHQKKLIDDKRNQYNAYVKTTEKVAPGDFPESAQLCIKCSTKAVIKMDGCMTCLNCGDSKCG